MTLNINLTPQLEKLVRQKVESGRYNSASEVVREALRLMEEQRTARASARTAAPRHPRRPGKRAAATLERGRTEAPRPQTHRVPQSRLQ